MSWIQRIDTEHKLARKPLEPGWKVLVTRAPAPKKGGGLFGMLEREVAGPIADMLRGPLDEAYGIVAGTFGLDAVLPERGARLGMGGRADVEVPDGAEVAIVHVVVGRTPPSRLPAPPPSTRLVVLDGAGEGFGKYGRRLVAGGGPAALRVDAELSTVRQEYLAGLYRRLSDGEPLSEAARPDPELEAQGLDVELFLGEGGDDLFPRAVPKMEAGPANPDGAKEESPPEETDKGSVGATGSGGRHKPNRTTFGRAEEAHSDTGTWFTVEGPRKEPPVVKKPGSEAKVEAEPPGEQVAQPPTTESAPPPAPARAQSPAEPVKPRVLNANFRPPGRVKKLGTHEALVAGAEYDFLVDVGPRWAEGESLVTGNAHFPADSLPPVKGGWVVDVALVSESLTPRVATGQIFVPVAEGRQSYPFVDGQRAEHPGPLALRVRAPAGDRRGGTFETTARLCLYYRNNLLQSANVRVGVRASVSARIAKGLTALVPELAVHSDEAEGTLEEPNTIKVDFVLSGSWRDLAAYERRNLRLDEGEADGLPVLASFTLNGDGSGQHRIIYKDDAELPPAFMPYDPAQAQRTLDAVRARLLECFFLKDPATYGLVPDGAGGWRNGLDDRNGKDRRQFKMDLAILARAGAELYEMVAGNLRPAEMDPLDWEERLRASGARAGVVQVARTGPANFALPWALMYEIPLVESDPARLRFCPSVDEDWGEDGRRRAHAGHTTCRHAGDADHQRDVICPYGFWGLRHVVEQPLGAVDPESGPDVQGASSQVVCGPDIELAVGITHDLGAGGEALRDAHLQRVAALPGVRYTPPPADGWNAVQRAMEGPEVAYFLCHGMYDAENGDVYLGVGRGNGSDQRIYSKNLMAWLRAGAGKQWRERRPLVFVNGCHTFEVEPGHMLNLLSTFNFGRASGVIGTEVKVQLPLAVEAADLLLGEVFAGEPLGKALWKMRWTLADKGNLLGLAYTMYALADLKLVVQKS